MASEKKGSKKFLGFGFGPIQGGLFLREAYRSGSFNRMVIAEIQPEIVQTLRKEGGMFTVNIAYHDHIEHEEIGPVEIYNPEIPEDQMRIISGIAEADEIATAIPSVSFYKSRGSGSIDRMIAQGIRLKKETAGPDCVVYTAENHNRAAEILQEHVMKLLAEPERDWAEEHVQFLNTVIGKMSQVVKDPAEIQEKELATVTQGLKKAFQVEAFNRILISKIELKAPFQRGIKAFEEKEDLLPFEEAKLFGHNAAHALIGYTGRALGLRFVSDIEDVPGFVSFIKNAFIKESGDSLIRKYRGCDPLFTEEGWRLYTDDLIERMMNPFLGDRIERVIRDPARKLGWNDRLVGCMRLAFSQGVQPSRYAFGAAAALDYYMKQRRIQETKVSRDLLGEIWGDSKRDPKEEHFIIQIIEESQAQFLDWLASGRLNLSELFPDA